LALGIFQNYIIRFGSVTPAPISVKRAIFGDPGLTYPYFNLRLFPYPWEETEKRNDSGYPVAQGIIRELNKLLKEKGSKITRIQAVATSIWHY